MLDEMNSKLVQRLNVWDIEKYLNNDVTSNEITEEFLIRNGFNNKESIEGRLIIFFKNRRLRTDILFENLQLKTPKDIKDLHDYLTFKRKTLTYA